MADLLKKHELDEVLDKTLGRYREYLPEVVRALEASQQLHHCAALVGVHLGPDALGGKVGGEGEKR